MFTHYRTQGFILKKNDRGEADQLLTVYTKDFGKLEILARAVRKISSKLRPNAELFYLSEIEFIQGRTYKTLTDAILIDKFKNLRKDLAKLAVAFKISEVFGNLVKGQEPDENIWQLLTGTFEKLNNWQPGSAVAEQGPRNFISSSPSLCSGGERRRQSLLGAWEIIYYYFFWNFLSLLGYQPEFYNCLQCQKRLLPEKLFFGAGEGGIICQNCFKKVELGNRGPEIDTETIKILRIILKKNWAILFKLKIQKSHLKSLSAISDYYLLEVLRQAG